MSVEHSSFVVERILPGSSRHAFRFWSDLAMKRRWTSCHPDWTILEDRLDFRIGGTEVTRWRTQEGVEQSFLAHYLDIVPAERIIYAYEMTLADQRISTSLVTVEFQAVAATSRMLYTEQVALLNGTDGKARAAGTEFGFERLLAAMEQELAPLH